MILRKDLKSIIRINSEYPEVHIITVFLRPYMRRLLLFMFTFLCVLNAHGQLAADYYNSAVAKMRLGNLQGALQDFNRAIEMKPKFGYAYCYRGAIKCYLRDSLGAIDDYNTALRLNPEDGNSFSGRGCVRCGIGDFKGAIEDLNKAIALNPNDAAAYFSRGMARINTVHLDAGCEDLQKAMKLGDSRAAEAVKKYCTDPQVMPE